MTLCWKSQTKLFKKMKCCLLSQVLFGGLSSWYRFSSTLLSLEELAKLTVWQ